jgi:hypothetical protein
MIAGMAKTVAVYLELGSRRVFASALDWPGWCRSGKGEEAALAALADYAPRYAAVAAEAGVPFPRAAGTFDVVERVPGGATTDFGAPEKAAARDATRVTPAQARRMAGLVAASWRVLDAVAAGAPAQLRKGPRGGGRDRDKVVEHVVQAEASYARKIGVRHRPPAPEDRGAVEALREAILAVLGAASDGGPLAEKGWPARYAARRIAWHVLDHAWEIEDRSEPA